MTTMDYIPDHCAELANAKLNALIENAPVVYGYIGKYGSSWNSAPPGTYIQEQYNYTARLIMIEDIVKEPCAHTRIDSIRFSDIGKCHKCGVLMIKEWKAKL